MRSGGDTSDRSAFLLRIFILSVPLIHLCSVKSLQAHIAQLESECDRLTRLSEAQKSTSELDAAATRNAEDYERKIEKRFSALRFSSCALRQLKSTD
jgi:hypothetical protein